MTTDEELRRQAGDPETPLQAIADLAYHHPELRAIIAANPSSYPDLLGWLAQLGEPDIDAALARRSTVAAGLDAEVPGKAQVRAPVAPSPARRPRKKLPLSLGVVAVIAILAVVVIVTAVVVPQQEFASAQSDFHTGVSDAESAQQALDAETQSATELFTSTTHDDVADPGTLDSLAQAIEAATGVDTTIPTEGGSTSELRALAAQLEEQVTYLTGLTDDLRAGRVAVNDSIHELRIQLVRPTDTHTVTVTDGNGNKENLTVSIGAWVKGSDTELLDEAWAIVGGDGSMPIVDADGFTVSDGAFVFGTVVVENLTTDFPADNFANGTTQVYLTPLIRFDGFFSNWHGPEFEGMGVAKQARQYSSGASVDTIGATNPLVFPAMDGNRWGAAPFVIGIDTVFTPNYPDGNPKLDEVVFALRGTGFTKLEGDSSFSIKRSW